ncbi:hypothetical protein C8Q74DRAFT_1286445 [Fomes fomentarius]|nr:hypothetical protein C8Q74DRAFT_1286445 [Fomes fomentarius]
MDCLETRSEPCVGKSAISLRAKALLVDAFSCHLIYDNILSRLELSSLIHLSAINRVIRHATQDFNWRAYNIDKRLKRFFKDPCAFRSLQARTAAIISGSFAVQFFDRSFYPDSDVDIFVHPNRDMLDIGLFVSSQGYTYQPMKWQQARFQDEVDCILSNMGAEPRDGGELEQMYGMPSLRAVFTFERAIIRDNAALDIQKIQIVVSRTSPVASVLDFHSTCVMNIITYNAAYSLYPRATFLKREALEINKYNPRAVAALTKYSERGWRIMSNPSPLLACLPHNAFHFDVERWVCDTKSWTIRLDMEGVTPPPKASPSSVQLDWDPAAECSWMLLHQNNPKAQVYFEVLHTTVLKWRYTAGCFPYWDVLVKFFVEQGKLEHRKIPAGKTRDDVANAWTWWDHVMPEFRKSYETRNEMWDWLAYGTP